MAESVNIQVRINVTDLATITQRINAKANRNNEANGDKYVVVPKSTCLRYVLEEFARLGKHITDQDKALEVLNDIYGSSGSGGVDVMKRLRGAVAGDVDNGGV